MDADALIQALGYHEAPGFLDAPRWREAPGHAHVFRHTDAACRGPKIRGRFRGIYTLGLTRNAQRRPSTPVVYVCEAPDAMAAAEIHRLTWLQSAAPFVIVHTPDGVHLYTGFDYDDSLDQTTPTSQSGVLEACIAFNQVAARLDAFRASQIDNGTLWAQWGGRLDPSRRVDTRLLENLKTLAEWLSDSSDITDPIAHALIGRFVYLRYLRDRGILTDARLRGWDLDPGEVFGRRVRLGSFHALLDKVDGWLNGSIFPLARSAKAKHVQAVARVMLGDEVHTGQHHLNFKAYDFSHIPIELLSSIYEQFMALEDRDAEAGAYYTPIPLVNFSLGELEDLCPLQEGMRVFDPACGSGAFLVQCYQLLIEKRRAEIGGDVPPRELRDLLIKHIFGLDRDDGACRVTELSLALALLDQIPTKVLSGLHNFKIPPLHNQNIFKGDFFESPTSPNPSDASTPAASKGSSTPHSANSIGESTEPWYAVVPAFDWIVGNPPWVKADAEVPAHAMALQWIIDHKKAAPVCGNQIAQAFAWKAPTHLRSDGPGVVAFVMPAMMFFEKQRSFRTRFLAQMDVKAVANLANLRRVLFHGRAEQPAAVIFYGAATGSSESVYVYSPMVVNQEANRPQNLGEQQTIWTITVDHSEVRRLRHDILTEGDSLPWKTSMWGSHRDLRLLQTVARRFQDQTLEEIAGNTLTSKFATRRLHISEGVQLRDKVAQKTKEGPELASEGDTAAAEANKRKRKSEKLDHLSDVTGKFELVVAPLREVGHVHSFPRSALRVVSAERSYVREGRGPVPLKACRPPHLILSAARTFAVYSDEFIVVPPRQIGISGSPDDADLLRVLALYMGSSFVRYHQFFLSPQEGIRGGRSTQDALLQVPIPFVDADAAALRPWVELHRELVGHSEHRWSILESPPPLGAEEALSDINRKMGTLQQAVDELAVRALGLQPQEVWLVDDLLQVRLDLIDGKVGDAASGYPSVEQLTDYARTLRDSLDMYLDRGEQFRHAVTIVFELRAGVVQVDFRPAAEPHTPIIEAADSTVGRHLRAMRDRIDREHGQWLYFDRNLVLYINGKVFLFKPMQRVHWTRSQALADADQIIADLVAAGNAA
jgi:N-6 DNA Methylase